MALRDLAARVAAAVGVAAPPRAERWDRWTANDPTSLRTLDHGPWSAFLRRHVVRDADGYDRIAYGSVMAPDRAALGRYIDGLAAERVSALAPAQQFAVWVNLYNALTVRVVLDHYPIASIRDIKLGGRGPWDKPLATIEGEPVSIGAIEHRILRPIWRDPRVHCVLNCASLGCPDIGAGAFPAVDADAALAAATSAFVNHPRGVRVGDRGVTLSSIFVWYADDFGVGGALPFIRRHANPPLRAALDRTLVSGHDYDWRLNDAGGQGAQP
ncbi:MAG: DUF547 domain-containing protein [Alphaproteobacteria bacterium]|nr:DUF547 domain-containing protein [Alphaproteobacteria bacterium]